MANYVVSDDPHVAEIAVAVAHDKHGVGVGTALMRQLGQIAFSRGIHRFTAIVLATNDLMRQDALRYQVAAYDPPRGCPSPRR